MEGIDFLMVGASAAAIIGLVGLGHLTSQEREAFERGPRANGTREVGTR